MKIFSCTSNINDQNNHKKQSIKVTQPLQTSNTIDYLPNIYFHPAQIAFGALKKHDFEGVDLAVVEKFKAPIEKFNSNGDLQDWAGVQAQEIANMDFGGRQRETVRQRQSLLKEWSDYVLYENDAYNNATALLILNAITKDLKPDNDKLPPVLNKGVLADCISEIDKNTKVDRKFQFDLNKMYETKLRDLYLEETQITDGNTGWVKIPSEENDPENFEENVKKLKTLSHRNWCTKSFNAEPYLSEGDFHVYLENGQPKLGVRFIGDKIQEIQGEKNDGEIPLSYFDKVKKHIIENHFELEHFAETEFKNAKIIRAKINKMKNDLKPAIESKDVKAIFEYFDIRVNEDQYGFLTISNYNQPNYSISFSDIGIDENILFEKVKVINGDADFEDSKVTNLGKLEKIDGSADFRNSQIKNLGNLKTIGSAADFRNSKVINLGNLKSIGWHADFRYSQITDLGNLESIGGNPHFEDSQVINLGKLKSIGGDVVFYNSQITDLGNLESIGGKADFRNSQITNLGKLKSIGNWANFRNSQVRDLGNLESIGTWVDFGNSQVSNLGKLKSIGDSVMNMGSLLTPMDFENINIGGGSFYILRTS